MLSVDEQRKKRVETVELILEDQREDALRGIPPEAIQDIVVVK